jgi:hypothetical protein
MLRAFKGVEWSAYLTRAEQLYLSTQIEPRDWYPMDTFERMGVAILREIARNDLTLVKHFGRVSLDALCKQYDNLVAPGDPKGSLLRFKELRQGLFNFSALDFEDLFDDAAVAIVSYEMGAVAEEAAAHQTMGFFERLLERAGGAPTRVSLSARSWAGDPTTRVQMKWTIPRGSGG